MSGSSLNQNSSSDESIIEKSPCVTPIKKKLKRTKHKIKCEEKPLQSVINNETAKLEELIKEFDKYEKQMEHKEYKNPANRSNYFNKSKSSNATHDGISISVTNNCFLNSLQSGLVFRHVDDIDSNASKVSYRGITQPIIKTVSKNYHKLYVFYLIDETLKFTPNNFPKNTWMQVIGILKFYDKTNSYYLCGYEKNYNRRSHIKIDLRQLSVMPDDGDEVIIFGVITFEENTPIVVAKFFQELAVSYRNYVALMLRLRTTVPQENFDMVCVTDDDLKYDQTLSEESDTEAIINDLSKHLTEEEFENSGLSDSKLCEFLNDISFENL